MFEISAINLSSRWDDDMKLDPSQPDSILFHKMLYAQKWGYLVMSTLSLYFCYRIATHSLMHFNFRIVLCGGSMFGIVFTGVRLLMYFMLASTPDLSDRTFNNLCCMALGTTNSMAISSLLLIMFLGCVERHMATVWVCHYESKKRTFGFAMLAFVLIVSFGTAIVANIGHLYSQFDLKTTYQTCIVVEFYPQVGFFSFLFGIGFCTASASWQFYLYRRNCFASRRGTGIDPLSVRFQQNENIHTTRLIFPALIGYILMCIWGLFLARHRYNLVKTENYAAAKVIMQLSYMSIDSFIVVFMCFILIFHPGLRANVKRDVMWLLCIKSDQPFSYQQRAVGIKDDTQVYFDQLAAAWK